MIRLVSIFMACCLALLMGGSPAFAASAEGDASQSTLPLSELDALANKALENTPSLFALRARLKAANERITAADAFPDPTLEMTMQEIGVYRFAKNSSFLLEYRQALPYPGKRQSRQMSAKAEALVQAAEEEALRRKIVAQVKIGYVRIYALDAERRVLATARELLNTLADALSARYKTGEAEQEALLKIRIETSRLGERELDIESERSQWVAVLNRLLDSPDETTMAEIPALPTLDSEELAEKALLERALQNAPEIAIAAASLKVAQSRAAEARLDQKPDFMLGVGAGLDGMPQPMVMLRLGIELPVFSKTKQEPLLRSARFEVEAATQDLREAQANTRAEARRISAQWQRDTKLVQRYTQAILPQTRAAFDASSARYVAGKGDFSQVVEDFDRWLEATTQLARRESERFITWIGIESLTRSMAKRQSK